MKKLILLVVIILGLYVFFHKNSENVSISVTEVPSDYTILAGDYSYSLLHQNQSRLFNVHVPPSYDGQKPVPLVLNLHGGSGDMVSAATQTGMNTKSDEAGFIVVYPQGVVRPVSEFFGLKGGTWNAGVYGGGYSYDNNIDDVGFISKLLDEVESKFNIDKKRIYSTGLSMGGMTSYRLACELSDRIAAIAPIASNLVLEKGSCKPTRPISVMHFQGTADRVVPYEGGESDKTLPSIFVVGGPYEPIKNTMKFFADLDSCSEEKVVTYKKGEVVCETQNKCSGGTEVTLCTINGGGHTWPGGTVVNAGGKWSEYVGNVTQDISANDAMWEFFQKHTL